MWSTSTPFAERGRERKLFAAYFSFQAFVAIGWWIALSTSPSVRERFELVPDRHQALNAFLLADLVMLVGGSVVTAWGLWHRAPWCVPLSAFTAGGLLYATLYLTGWVVINGAAPTGLVPMACAAAVTTAIAARLFISTR